MVLSFRKSVNLIMSRRKKVEVTGIHIIGLGNKCVAVPQESLVYNLKLMRRVTAQSFMTFNICKNISQNITFWQYSNKSPTKTGKMSNKKKKKRNNNKSPQNHKILFMFITNF